MYLSQLLKHLQSDHLRPCYVAFGNNPFEMREVVAALRERAARDGDASMSVVELGPDERNLADVMDALRGAPMFADYRMVVMQGADEFVNKHRKALESYCAQPSPSGVLVMTVDRWNRSTKLAKAVQQLGGDVSCWAPRNEGELLDWTQRRARATYGKRLSAAAAQMLVDSCQGDLGAIDAELAKLAIYVGDAPAVSEEDVSAASMGYGAFRLWDLPDRLADGDRRGALEAVEGLVVEGMPAVAMIATLRGSFRRLLEARLAVAEMGEQAAVNKFAGPPKRRDAFRRQLARFSEDHLVGAFTALLEADVQAKTSRYPDRVIVERLVLALSRSIPAAATGPGR